MSLTENENKRIPQKTKVPLSIAITNARSLKPKIQTAIDCFEENALSLMIVTESWLQNGADTDEMVNTLREGHGISTLVKHRKK